MVRAGINFMVEDIIMAGLNPEEEPGFGIAVATSTSIQFTADRNMNGTPDATDLEEITYRYIPADNRLEQCLYETVDPPGDCEDFID